MRKVGLKSEHEWKVLRLLKAKRAAYFVCSASNYLTVVLHI